MLKRDRQTETARQTGGREAGWKEKAWVQTDRQTDGVKRDTTRETEAETGRNGERKGDVVVCWLLNVPANMDLLRQFHVLPH